jgi:RNA-splicing ligase RtcB
LKKPKRGGYDAYWRGSRTEGTWDSGTCKDPGVIDEIPGAYKDIDEVMAHQNDLVEIVAKLKQFLCVKG